MLSIKSTVSYASNTIGRRQKILIIGSGWAGFTLLKSLDSSLYDITVISPRSYFVFTPLLAGTAVGTLEFRCALESVRNTKKCNFHEAFVKSIDFDNRRALCSSALHSRKSSSSASFEIEYDKLVLSAGCYSNTFNIPGVSEYGHFLKDVKDARAIRSRILKCFEEANLPTTSPEERDRLLSFVVVGGGPTGIEFAAELYDLVNDNLRKLYPDIQKHVTIDIYDVADHILGSFDQKLAEYAQQRFVHSGIRVHTKMGPVKIEKDKLLFNKGYPEKPYGCLVWSTGLMPNPLVQSLTQCAKHKHSGALITNDFLQVQTSTGEAMEDVYAIGDCATTANVLPATAQVASQKGLYLAKAFNKAAFGVSPRDFVFKNRGIMAFLGGGSAIVQGSGSKGISGRAAYLIWKFAYLSMTVSFRNKLLILIYWGLNSVLGRDINRF